MCLFVNGFICMCVDFVYIYLFVSLFTTCACPYVSNRICLRGFVCEYVGSVHVCVCVYFYICVCMCLYASVIISTYISSSVNVRMTTKILIMFLLASAPHPLLAAISALTERSHKQEEK